MIRVANGRVAEANLRVTVVAIINQRIGNTLVVPMHWLLMAGTAGCRNTEADCNVKSFFQPQCLPPACSIFLFIILATFDVRLE